MGNSYCSQKNIHKPNSDRIKIHVSKYQSKSASTQDFSAGNTAGISSPNDIVVIAPAEMNLYPLQHGRNFHIEIESEESAAHVLVSRNATIFDLSPELPVPKQIEKLSTAVSPQSGDYYCNLQTFHQSKVEIPEASSKLPKDFKTLESMLSAELDSSDNSITTPSSSSSAGSENLYRFQSYVISGPKFQSSDSPKPVSHHDHDDMNVF